MSKIIKLTTTKQEKQEQHLDDVFEGLAADIQNMFDGIGANVRVDYTRKTKPATKPGSRS